MRGFNFAFSLVFLFALASAAPVAAVDNDYEFNLPTTVLQPAPAFLATCMESRPETPREPTIHTFGMEPVQDDVSRTVAGVLGCPAWVYMYAMNEIQRSLDEECGVGNSYISHVYCITLQEGGYHVMAEADCLS